MLARLYKTASIALATQRTRGIQTLISHPNDVILHVGNGQLGSRIIPSLDKKYGAQNVIIADIHPEPPESLTHKERYRQLDVSDSKSISDLFTYLERRGKKVTAVINNAALLSGACQQNPALGEKIMVDGLKYLTATSILHGVRVFFNPSSIGVIGERSDNPFTQESEPDPGKLYYGQFKVAGEELGAQLRSGGFNYLGIRYPGVFSVEIPPGKGITGTTECLNECMYANFFQQRSYEFFIGKNRVLPMTTLHTAAMMTIALMESDIPAEVSQHASRLNMVEAYISPEDFVSALAETKYNETRATYKPDLEFGRDNNARVWSRQIEMLPFMKQLLDNLPQTRITDAQSMVAYGIERLEAIHGRKI